MGNRANVCIKSSEAETPVFFYTHWNGSNLPNVVAEGLRLGRSRWGDTPYLSRIIFCKMIEGDEGGLTGYGISTTVQDNEYNRPILVVDDDKQTVGLAHESTPTVEFSVTSYESFIKKPGLLDWK